MRSTRAARPPRWYVSASAAVAKNDRVDPRRPRQRSERPNDAHTAETRPSLGNVSDWHPFTDPLHKQSTTMKRQTGVTVRHEDLRLVKTAISTHAPGVFAYVNDQSPTSWPGTPRMPAGISPHPGIAPHTSRCATESPFTRTRDVPGAVVVLGPVSDTAAPRPVDEHVNDKLVGLLRCPVGVVTAGHRPDNTSRD